MKSTRTPRQSNNVLFTKPRHARRDGDPIFVLGLDDGQRLPRQMRDGESLADAWEHACESGVFVGGERVRIGLAYAYVMLGEHELDESVPVEWFGYRNAPEFIDADESEVTP